MHSTQTPYKLGHIADHIPANSCPIHKGPEQEAYGALQLRVRTFQWKHKSEPTSDYSLARGTVSPYGKSESQALTASDNAKGHGLHPTAKILPCSLPKWLGSKKENTEIFSTFSVCMCTEFNVRRKRRELRKKVLQSLKNSSREDSKWDYAIWKLSALVRFI